MKNSIVVKIMTGFLTVVMVITSLPMQIFAQEIREQDELYIKEMKVASGSKSDAKAQLEEEGAVGFGALIAAVIRTTMKTDTAKTTSKVLNVLEKYQEFSNNLGELPVWGFNTGGLPVYSPVPITTLNGEQVFVKTCDEWANVMIAKYFPDAPDIQLDALPFEGKLSVLDHASMTPNDTMYLRLVHDQVNKTITPAVGNQQAAEQTARKAIGMSSGIGKLTASLYIVGGAMMIYTAIALGVARYNQRHPDYADIPVALVDLVTTVDGDRFVKYDAVLEAEPGEDGTYAPGDTNAFAGERWNALYFTRSYEAGQPLLAEIVVSYDNNKPGEGYAPVHRFGEIVSYDLNKYCFSSKADSVYLSVKQSENNKSAVEDVPSLIGSLISSGILFLAVGGGVLAGAGLTYAVQQISKKKKNKKEASSPVTGDDSGK